ncbi:MAG: hypothetical protein QM636_13295 [Rhizobium sp.]
MAFDTSDHDLIDAMKRYFMAKAEAGELRARLEAARREKGEEIDGFYDPRSNPDHAADILRSHALRQEMVLLMQRAEDWAKAQEALEPAGSEVTANAVDVG